MGIRLGISIIAGAGALCQLMAADLATAADTPARTPAAAAEPAFALTAAGDDGALTIRGTPGQSERRSVLVRNTSSRRIVVRIEAADIRNAANGNADFVAPDDRGAGRWIDLSRRHVRLAPRAAQRVDLEVRVPRDAAKASHYAGIVGVDEAQLTRATTSRPQERSTSFTFARVNRQAIPITVRLGAKPARDLTLRSVLLEAAPSGAGLILALRPGGTVLTDSAPIRLRVSRGARTVFTHTATLGQLFPGSGLRYRIPWQGQPTAGSYRVTGMIYPARAARVPIDETFAFTPAAAAELAQVTPGAAATPTRIPPWFWAVLAVACALLFVLSVAVARLRRRKST